MIKGGIDASRVATIIIVVLILALSAYILLKDNPAPAVSTEEAKCIGQKSELYVQTGCSACTKQEEMFGDNVKYLNMIDCFLMENRQDCTDNQIEATPTWIINGEKVVGVQEISKLKELTGC